MKQLLSSSIKVTSIVVVVEDNNNGGARLNTATGEVHFFWVYQQENAPFNIGFNVQDRVGYYISQARTNQGLPYNNIDGMLKNFDVTTFNMLHEATQHYYGGA